MRFYYTVYITIGKKTKGWRFQNKTKAFTAFNRLNMFLKDFQEVNITFRGEPAKENL